MKEQVSRLAKTAIVQYVTVFRLILAKRVNRWNSDLGLETERHHIASFDVGGDESLASKSRLWESNLFGESKIDAHFWPDQINCFEGRPLRVPLKTPRLHPGKNNRFPFLDILGYLKNTRKNPNLEKWDKSQPGNSQPSSLVGTCLTLPNLGFLWVFFKYPKISKNGNLLFFPVLHPGYWINRLSQERVHVMIYVEKSRVICWYFARIKFGNIVPGWLWIVLTVPWTWLIVRFPEVVDRQNSQVCCVQAWKLVSI